MDREELRVRAVAANVALERAGLIVLAWGNASQVDRDAGLFAIKPSGVPYAELGPADMVPAATHAVVPVTRRCSLTVRPTSGSSESWPYASLSAIRRTAVRVVEAPSATHAGDAASASVVPRLWQVETLVDQVARSYRRCSVVVSHGPNACAFQPVQPP